MVTTPTLWKLQTQVNTSEAVAGGLSYQEGGRIAALDDGGYVVAWSDLSHVHNPAGYAVVGQRYDVFGEKIGGEFKISSFNTGNQYVSGIASAPGNGVLVAWTDSLSGQNDIYVQAYDSGFTPRRDLIDVSTLNTGGGEVASFADGSYVIAYCVVASNTDVDIVARIVSPTGAVGAAFDILDEPDNPKGQIDIDTLSNGNFVVTFGRTPDGIIVRDVMFAIYTPTGQPVAPPQFVAGASDAAAERNATVAALKGGGFVVTWWEDGGDGDGAGVRATIYTGTGAPGPRTDFLVNTTETGSQYGPSVAALEDGGFVVTWKYREIGYDVMQRFDAAGNPVGEEVNVKQWSGAGENSGLISIDTATLEDGRFAYAIGDLVSAEETSDADVVTSIWDPRTGPILGTAGDDDMANRLEGGALNGGAGNDRLYGSGNPDTLAGGPGTDYLRGGVGNDVYVDPAGDTIVENPGEGTDLVRSGADYALGNAPNVERLVLTGAAPVKGIGNELANLINGNGVDNAISGLGGNDNLNGLGGDDTLNGGDGADTLAGGAGDDTYITPAGDIIVEGAGAAGGLHDRIQTTASFNLSGAANVEDIALAGAAAANAIGNNFANILIGNGAANTLIGGGGADTLTGGGGNDAMNGGSGADLFRFAAANTGADRIDGFEKTLDHFDLAGGTFAARTEAGGNTTLTHAGGTILVAGVTGLALAGWNDLVVDGARVAADGDAHRAIPFPAVHGAFGHADFLLA